MENNENIPLFAYADEMNLYQVEINEPVRVSKQSVTDERLLIGALFYEQNNPAISVREILLKVRKEWFRTLTNQAVFEAMGYQAQSDKALSATAMSLYSQVKKAYEKVAVGPLDDVISADVKKMQMEWLRKIKRLSDADKYNFLGGLIDVVQDRFKQHSLSVFAKTLPQMLKSDKTEKDKLMEIKRVILQIDESFRFLQDNQKSVQAVAKTILTRAIERSQSNNKQRILGYTSGYGEFDEQISGICQGRYHIIAARPSMGKTTFALNLILNMAKDGKQVALFSYEMSKEQIVSKLLGIITKINPRRLQLGDLSAEEWTRYSKAVEDIEKLSVQIFDVQELGTNDVSVMIDQCRQMHKQGLLDVVFIDYIQLMSDANAKKADPVLSLSNISLAIQKASRSLNLPFVVLAQLNRSVEQRQDKRPRNSDLKGSGSLEQDADVIVFLHRDEYYEGTDEKAQLSNITSFIFSKNREGEKDAVISLEMQPSIGVFSNLSPINLLPNNQGA